MRPSASITSSASPAPFHNLRLEHYTPEGFPAGWYVEAEASVGAKRGEVTLHPHTADRREGARALYVANKGDGPAVLYTPLRPGSRCITELTVAAAVRARDSARVALFLLLPGSGRPDASLPAPGTDRWETLRHRWTRSECLREDAVFGVLITGRGAVWLDDLSLATNGAAHVDPTALIRAVSRVDRRTLERVALRVDSLNRPRAATTCGDSGR